MDEVGEELHCPICLELFTCPVILPCSHVLCQQPCAERLFDSGFVRCPVCRDTSYVIGGLDTLPRVISLDHIIQTYRNRADAADANHNAEQSSSRSRSRSSSSSMAVTTHTQTPAPDAAAVAADVAADVAAVADVDASCEDAASADFTAMTQDDEDADDNDADDDDDDESLQSAAASASAATSAVKHGNGMSSEYEALLAASGACAELLLYINVCDVCHVNKADVRCVQCDIRYCKHCARDSHPYTTHQLTRDSHSQRCSVHSGADISTYCQDCHLLLCILCADSQHHHHNILSVDQAGDMLARKLSVDLRHLHHSEERVTANLQRLKQQLDHVQETAVQRRNNINEQFEVLFSELQAKRQFFLAQLEYEVNSQNQNLAQEVTKHQNALSDVISAGSAVQSLLDEHTRYKEARNYVTFVQVAESTNEKMRNVVCDSASLVDTVPQPAGPRPPGPVAVIDARKERATIRDMTYLAPPGTPVINMSGCSRSADLVVILLSPPTLEYDVINGYTVYYHQSRDHDHSCRPTHAAPSSCTQHTSEFSAPSEERMFSRGPPSGNAVCLLVRGLCSSSSYHFYVRAYNDAGESPVSEVVHCQTLDATDECTSAPHLTVPEITHSLCKTYTHSIQIHSASTVTHTAAQQRHPALAYYLMYREATGVKLWKSVAMYGRLEHRVFGLESGTPYEFLILLCDSDGRCVVSDTVTLTTEVSGY